MADPALRQKVAETYPAFAWLLDIPEVGGLLEQAAAEGWDTTRLQASLYATAWWRGTSQTSRNWQTLVNTDPAEAVRQRSLRHSEVADEIRRLGLKLTYEEELWVTEMSLINGNSRAQITQAIVQISRSHGITDTGTVRQTSQQIRELSKRFAYPVSGATALDWAYNVAAGRMTLEGVEAQMRESAKDKYGDNINIMRGLDRGMTVWDIMQPVLGRVSEELGISPDGFDLTEGWGAQLVNYRDPKTNQLRLMDDTEATTWARSQERWRNTANGRGLTSQLAGAITEKFGRR